MKKSVLIFLAVFFLFGGCTATRPDAQKDSQTKGEEQLTYRQISENEALEFIAAAQEEYILLDVRTHEEFNLGHIEGAICIPNETIGTEELDLLPDKDALILVYCRSGNRSKQASQKLVNMGYTNVVEFGGIINWQGATVTSAE